MSSVSPAVRWSRRKDLNLHAHDGARAPQARVSAISPRRDGALGRTCTFTLSRASASETDAAAITPRAQSRRPGDRTRRSVLVEHVCSPAHSPPMVQAPRVELGHAAYQAAPHDRCIRLEGCGTRGSNSAETVCETAGVTRRSRPALVRATGIEPAWSCSRSRWTAIVPRPNWFLAHDSNVDLIASKASVHAVGPARKIVPTERVERSATRLWDACRSERRRRTRDLHSQQAISSL